MIGRKVRVYCNMCHRYINGVLLDYDSECSVVPYTVATFKHYLRGRDWQIESFSEVEFVDWEDVYECKKEK